MSAGQAAPAVRRPDQVPASPLRPGVTAAEMLDDRHGCRGLHQRRLRFAGGAGIEGTAGGQGEAWYVITGSGVLDTERTGRIALEPGTAVWLEGLWAMRARRTAWRTPARTRWRCSASSIRPAARPASRPLEAPDGNPGCDPGRDRPGAGDRPGVLAILLALASAIGYGGSDFAAGLAARSAGVIQVTLLASAVSAVVVAAALPFAASHPPTAAAMAWGAVAGLGGTTGAFALYLGFRHAAFSVAAPISAVGAAGFSVLAGLLLGERPTALALTGIALALPAIVGVSASAASAGDTPPEEAAAGGRPAAGVVRGLVAGACFALLFIGLDRAGTAPRAAACGRSPPPRSPSSRRPSRWPWPRATSGCPAARPRLLAAITGAAGAAGTILFFFATHQGFLAVTAVLTSLYPAVTIVLARTMLGERLTALRLAGLTLAAACVALIAVGGAG